MMSADGIFTSPPPETDNSTTPPALAARANYWLLPLDFSVLLLAGYASLWAYALWFPAAPGALSELPRLIWIASALAPFALYERRLGGSLAFARGFLMFLVLTAAIAFSGRWFAQAPAAWLMLWCCAALLLTASSRLMMALALRRASAQIAVAAEIPASIPGQIKIGLLGDGLRVALLADRPIKRMNAVLKSAEDLLLGAAIASALLPVLALIALAIKLDSPGPVLFKQRRHGFNNREFSIYKFRSMHVAAAEPDQALRQTVRGDSRITRVGGFLRRFSLDELPQLLNVIEGSMSLVGPRPHAVNMTTEDQLGHQITDVYPHRHRVKPGITGWAQVNGSRGATDTIEQLRRRIELDLHYVDHWSLLLDLKILVLTFIVVLRGNNAY